MATRETPRLVSLTPVKRGREKEFEAFIQDVIVPATRQHRPQLMGQWQALRPGEQLEDGTRAHVFLFYGDNIPVEDWDLESLFTTAFGEQEGNQRLQQWVDLLDGGQTIVFVGAAIPND